MFGHPRAEDLRQGLSRDLGERSPRERFRCLVHQNHPVVVIRGDHAFGDVVHGDVQEHPTPPQLLLRAVFVQRKLDRDRQFTLLKRFEEITVGLRPFRPLQAFAIGERRQEDHRHIAVPLDSVGRPDSVDLTPQLDIHEDQVRLFVGGEFDRGGPRAGLAHDVEPHDSQTVLQVECDDAFVFDDQNASCHDAPRARELPAKSSRGLPTRRHRRV